jgi:ParB-like chromosome segregation protein Spo0J
MSKPVITILPIEQIKLNDANPRYIKDNRFEQLVQSLIEFPDMLHIRPIVIDEDGVALGGNMRMHAALRLAYTEVPTIRVVGWSEEKKREFIIKDNASFGEWDWDVLGNEWSDMPLEAWGSMRSRLS